MKKIKILFLVCIIFAVSVAIVACGDTTGVEITQDGPKKTPVSSNTPAVATGSAEADQTATVKPTATIDIDHVVTFDVETEDPSDPTATSSEADTTPDIKPTSSSTSAPSEKPTSSAVATPSITPTTSPTSGHSTPIVLPPVWFD